MKRINITNRKGEMFEVLLDDDDFEELNKFKWYVNHGYAVRKINAGKGNRQKMQWMHRMVNKTKQGLDTDHINGNKLDNRKKNLRSCTHRQNMMNMGAGKNNKLGIKGVNILTIKRKSKVYQYIRAQICLDGKKIMLGSFPTVEEASRAHQEASNKYYGNYARLGEVKV